MLTVWKICNVSRTNTECWLHSLFRILTLHLLGTCQSAASLLTGCPYKYCVCIHRRVSQSTCRDVKRKCTLSDRGENNPLRRFRIVTHAEVRGWRMTRMEWHVMWVRSFVRRILHLSFCLKYNGLWASIKQESLDMVFAGERFGCSSILFVICCQPPTTSSDYAISFTFQKTPIWDSIIHVAVAILHTW